MRAPSRDNHALLWVLLPLRGGHLWRHRGGHEEHALRRGGASLGGGIVGALKRVQGRTVEGDDHGRTGGAVEREYSRAGIVRRSLDGAATYTGGSRGGLGVGDGEDRRRGRERMEGIL